MANDSNIFNSWLELDCFCYDIIEAWIKYRKSKNKTYTEDDWTDWVQDELEPAMYSAYKDCVEDEEDEND